MEPATDLEDVATVQREIENLVVALFNEQEKERELLQNILAAIACGRAARQQMIEEIAKAAGSARITFAEDSGRSKETVEAEVSNAVRWIRKRAA